MKCEVDGSLLEIGWDIRLFWKDSRVAVPPHPEEPVKVVQASDKDGLLENPTPEQVYNGWRMF